MRQESDYINPNYNTKYNLLIKDMAGSTNVLFIIILAVPSSGIAESKVIKDTH